MIGALFVRLATQHYYFGDYFDNRYATLGFVPWPDFRTNRGGYDPNYNYYRHQHAADPRWESGIRDLYRGRNNGEVPRPPRTLVQQARAIKIVDGNKTGHGTVGKNANLANLANVTALATLKEVHNTRVTNLGALSQPTGTALSDRLIRLQPVPKDEHAQEQKAAAQLREAGQRRRDVEGKLLMEGGVPVHHMDPPKAVNLDLPKPRGPVAAPAPFQRSEPLPAQRQSPPAGVKPPPIERRESPVQRQPPPPRPHK